MMPLLLIPGMMCDARLYAPQLEHFSSQRTLSVVHASGAQSMAQQAAEVLQQSPPHFALLGLSYGGIVAMEMLRQAPERIQGIALLDTNPYAETDSAREQRLKQLKKLKRDGLDALMQDEIMPRYPAATSDHPKITELGLNMARSFGASVFEAQAQALMQRCDQTATLKHFNKPALVLCGSEDQLCPPAQHQVMHQCLANSSYHVIADAGHLPTLEQPLATNRIIAGWLARL